MGESDKKSIATRAVHAGTGNETEGYTSMSTPIHHGAAYYYKKMEHLDQVFAGTKEGYCYSRHGNPTVHMLENAMADLEGGDLAFAFASGMAAIHAALIASGVKAGARVVAAQDLYGATYVLLDGFLAKQGVTVRFVDATNLKEVSAACDELKPTVILVETVSNPLLRIADIQALSRIAHGCNASLLVDATFSTPYLSRPLTMGADMVIHSATKYIGGHSDSLGGIVVANSAMKTALFEVMKIMGANLGPEDAWLLLRGLKTLPLRMREHCANAMAVANWLDGHPKVGNVFYPGLTSHPQHGLAKELFGSRGYGGMVSFELTGAGREEIFGFFESLNICLPATTLGDVCTLVLYPAHSSHRGLTERERSRIGISDSLVRMSVGIESPEDIIGDIQQGLLTV